MLPEPQTLSAILVGPFIGSFAGLLVERLPLDQPVIWARSRCGRCARCLSAIELVPLVSWFALRGHCRSCGGPIPELYPAMEAAFILVAIWSAMVAPAPMLWPSCLLGWTLLTLSVIDARTFLLPNVLTLPLIPAGLATACLESSGRLLDGLLGSLVGFTALFLLAKSYLRLRRRPGLGHGDAKLLAGIGAWIGWEGLPSAALIAAITALVFAIATSRKSGLAGDTRVPFGPFLALGGWLAWLYGPLTLL